jgi:hypothetical protein
MFKEYLDNNIRLTEAYFSDINEEIENEKNNITKDNVNISKLEQAKIMRTLFNQNNIFGSSSRYNNPW